MISGFARLLLAVSAAAPVLVVHGASLLGSRNVLGIWLIVAAFAVSGACLAVLAVAGRQLEHSPLEVKSAKVKDSEILPMLLSYLLPVVMGARIEGNAPALIAFSLIFVAVLVRCNVVHVNPLLGLFGYHFYQVETVQGAEKLLVTRSPEPPRAGRLVVRDLSTGLVLQTGNGPRR